MGGGVAVPRTTVAGAGDFRDVYPPGGSLAARRSLREMVARGQRGGGAEDAAGAGSARVLVINDGGATAAGPGSHAHVTSLLRRVVTT